jgi:hypothetical protein
VAKIAAALGRACGSCSLCCKVLPISEPEIAKPANVWCQHCKPGRGCSIYADRPLICRAFTCQWLVDGSFGDHWKPARSKMVLRMIPNRGSLILYVYPDPGYPGAWRKQPYYAELKERSTRMGVIIHAGPLGRIGILPEHDLDFRPDQVVHDAAKGRAPDDGGGLPNQRCGAVRLLAVFGLTPMPQHAAPSFDRLARCDHLGLVWLLRGRRVVDLTADAATIRTKTGSPLRFYKPHRG